MAKMHAATPASSTIGPDPAERVVLQEADAGSVCVSLVFSSTMLRNVWSEEVEHFVSGYASRNFRKRLGPMHTEMSFTPARATLVVDEEIKNSVETEHRSDL